MVHHAAPAPMQRLQGGPAVMPRWWYVWLVFMALAITFGPLLSEGIR